MIRIASAAAFSLLLMGGVAHADQGQGQGQGQGSDHSQSADHSRGSNSQGQGTDHRSDVADARANNVDHLQGQDRANFVQSQAFQDAGPVTANSNRGLDDALEEQDAQDQTAETDTDTPDVSTQTVATVY